MAALATSGPAAAAPGDVYVVDSQAFANNGGLFRVPAGGGAPQTLVTDPMAEMQSPTGMTLARNGRLLVADFSNRIWSVNRSTGAFSPFATLANPVEVGDLAFAPSGHLIATNTQGAGSLIRINRATKEATTIATNFTGAGDDPGSIAVARNGTVFVSNWEQSVFRVKRGGAVTTLASDPRLSGADGLALSPNERFLYVASFGSPNGNCCAPPNTVWRIRVGTGAISKVATVDDAVAVSLRPDRSFLVSDVDNDVILRVGPGGSPITNFSTAGAPFDYPHDTVIQPRRCGGRLPTVVGTNRRDVLRGSRFADVISALGGNDVIRGLAGNDVVCGGKGRDRLLGGKGRDRLLGGPGRDKLLGGPGRDRAKQ